MIMSGDVVIRVDNVAKKFCRSLRHVMFYGAKDIARNALGLSSRSGELRDGEFWAVNDVSFELRRGEALGLVGPNGSGKTTLLKMLNGIFMPDKGRIEIRGRVGALIQVGAGFHPMLTGRENVYVNGAILGMSKKEIDEKFDEIVDFAEIGDFIDAPVKHYSSGMYVRLGFAIAAHCEPDIMLIDEILAVGDFTFRTKCLHLLNEMKKQGTTFILVSHSMTNIIQFTSRTLYLDKGVLKADGPSFEVSTIYVEEEEKKGEKNNLYGNVLTDNPDVEDAVINLKSDSPTAGEHELVFGEYVTLEFCFKTRRELIAPNVSFPIYHKNGFLMSTLSSVANNLSWPRGESVYSGSVRFGPINFNPGSYIIVANLHDGPEHLFRSIVAQMFVKNSSRITWGVVDFNQTWKLSV